MKSSFVRLLSLLTLAIVAASGSVAEAAPQDNAFSRPSDNKNAEAPAESEPVAKKEVEDVKTGISIAGQPNADITQQSDGWYTISDRDSNSVIRLPGKPKYKQVSFSPIEGRGALTNHLYTVIVNGQSSVTYSWYDMHEAPKTGAQLKETLDGAVRGSVVNVLGRVDRMEGIKSGKIPGREFDFTFTVTPPKTKKELVYSGRSRVFVSGKRRYQIDVLSPKGKEEAGPTKKLFDSLIMSKQN